MADESKSSRTLILTGAISVLCWLGFVVTVQIYQSQGIGALLLILAVVTLLRFGQLLDKRLQGVI